MTTPAILNVYPSNGAQGIPVADQVKVYFNQEMDLSSINTGTFVLVGKDEAPVFGPIDVTPLDEPGFDDEDILSSPYVGAYVKGTITYFKTNASGTILDDDSIYDYDGDGSLWYTLGVFTPDKPLEPNSGYKAFILGDENLEDEFDTGVRTRTVFDTENVTVSGTGSVTFEGGYTGDEETTYIVQIIAGGVTGTATYRWWKESAPLVAYEGITTTGERELEEGIVLTCSADGTFTAGDKFSATVIPAVPLENNYSWTFTTGSGSIQTPPSTTSTSGIEAPSSEGLSGGLIVTGSDPEDRESNLAITGLDTITVTFNKTLESSSINNTTVKVRTESVNGDPAYPADGELAKTLTVDGNQIIIRLS